MSRSRLAYTLIPFMLYAAVAGAVAGYNIRNSEISRLNTQLQDKTLEVGSLRDRARNMESPTRAEIYGRLIILGEGYHVAPTEVARSLKQYEEERGLDYVDGCAIIPKVCVSRPLLDSGF